MTEIMCPGDFKPFCPHRSAGRCTRDVVVMTGSNAHCEVNSALLLEIHDLRLREVHRREMAGIQVRDIYDVLDDLPQEMSEEEAEVLGDFEGAREG